MTDQELKKLATELKDEQKKRKLQKKSDDELYTIAKAKNGEYSEEEAVSALNVLLNKEKPNLELISSLKQMSHSETVRDQCENYLFG